MKRDVPAGPVCKITMQYWAGDGFVYELETAGVTLAVRVSRDVAKGQSANFSVAAHHGKNADSAVSESGASGAEALRNVERTWTARSSECGLPSIDWNGVAAALVSVRAI